MGDLQDRVTEYLASNQAPRWARALKHLGWKGTAKREQAQALLRDYQAEASTQSAELKTNVDGLTAELEQTKTKYQTALTDLGTATSQMENLGIDVAKGIEAIDTLTRDLERRTGEYADKERAYTEQITNLTSALQTADQKVLGLEQTARDLSAAKAQLETDYAALQGRVNSGILLEGKDATDYKTAKGVIEGVRKGVGGIFKGLLGGKDRE